MSARATWPSKPPPLLRWFSLEFSPAWIRFSSLPIPKPQPVGTERPWRLPLLVTKTPAPLPSGGRGSERTLAPRVIWQKTKPGRYQTRTNQPTTDADQEARNRFRISVERLNHRGRLKLASTARYSTKIPLGDLGLHIFHRMTRAREATIDQTHFVSRITSFSGFKRAIVLCCAPFQGPYVTKVPFVAWGLLTCCRPTGE